MTLGDHNLSVVGKNSEDLWQWESRATTFTWSIVEQTDFTAPEPVDIEAFSTSYIAGGTAYSAGDSIGTEDLVLYQGSCDDFTPFTDTGIPEGQWIYRAYAHDEALNYGAGGTMQPVNSYDGVLYVHHSGELDDTCTIDDPANTVQRAINLISAFGFSGPVEIHVAGDETDTQVYGPYNPGDPVISLVNDVSILGGYDPDDWNSRNWETYRTVITDGTTWNDRSFSTVYGDGVSNVVLNGLDIRGSATTGGYNTAAIKITGSSSDVQIRRCYVEGGATNTDMTYSTSIEIVDSDVTVLQNHSISGGGGYTSVGIYVLGTSSDVGILGNDLITGGSPYAGPNSTAGAVSIEQANTITIRDNTIRPADIGASVETNAYGVFHDGGGSVLMNSIVIDKNIILGQEAGNAWIHGVYVKDTPSLDIRNNFIYCDSSDRAYCVYTGYVATTIIRNNTIVTGGGETTLNEGIYLQWYENETDEVFIENNILQDNGDSTGINTAVALGIGIGAVAMNLTMDKNNFDGWNLVLSDFVPTEWQTVEDLANDPNNDFIGNTDENLTVSNTDGQVSADLGTREFDTNGYDGAGQSPAWSFTDDLNGTTRTGNGTTGWSMGCYEYDP